MTSERDFVPLPPTAPGSGLVVVNRVPNASDVRARRELLARHGVTGDADDTFDAVTDHLAEQTGFGYAMVNFALENQSFAGLHNPPPDSGLPIVGRSMAAQHGFCPHVVSRRRRLPLPNVHASRLYSGNFVVDALGIQSYIGDVLIYPGTDMVLGTVCVIDPTPRSRPEGDLAMKHVTGAAADVLRDILAR